MDRRPVLKAAILIPIDDDFGLRAASALRFVRRLRGKRPGPLPRALRLTPLRRGRLILMLRALDADQAGASYRQIASVLLDPAAAHIPARDWKESALQSRVFRLVNDAIGLMNGGYLELLRGG